MSVYKAINAVQAEIAKIGISKAQENKFDNYKFRGIDDVYNALAPIVAKHGLCILPRVISRTVEERQSQKGGALFYVTIDVEYDLVAAEDGSKHTVKMVGEAMDRGDKATNKAMSAAYKNFAFQTFIIPIEGDNDSENQTHEVKAIEPTRTMVMKISNAIASNLADGKESSALEEWMEVYKWNDESLADQVWARLTSPERLTVRRLQTEQEQMTKSQTKLSTGLSTGSPGQQSPQLKQGQNAATSKNTARA
jgi:hypothetical protein